ncbi:phosphopantetheine-binding protein [Catellatospora methionotrophica]|uniref:phosphopantetheine-binding protein n=1 Tax=Catellatospora methionotrophica TaxID=121620 RepID=UPI0033EAD706
MDRAEGTEAISRVWCAVLELDSVDPDLNFFEAGGQSILVLSVHEHLEQLAGRPIPVEDLFHHSTVRAQAEYLFDEPAEQPVLPAPRSADRQMLIGRGRRATGDGS